MHCLGVNRGRGIVEFLTRVNMCNDFDLIYLGCNGHFLGDVFGKSIFGKAAFGYLFRLLMPK